jgi:DNA-binding MarR family transcriptional regulator
MKVSSIIDLPADYTSVLQQIQEDNGDDFTMLSETLNIKRSRLSHIIDALKRKGLVKTTIADFGDVWIRLSARGSKLISGIWPETTSPVAF